MSEEIKAAIVIFKRIVEIDDLDFYNQNDQLRNEKRSLIETFDKLTAEVQRAAIDAA
jgi:hypothetical protein